MSTEKKEIKFYEGTLLGIKDEDGQVWLAIRRVCLDIGLSDGQTRRQLANLKEDLTFKKAVTNLRYPSKGGEQETTCISEKFVTLWLAKISLTPAMQKKNPEAVQKLLTYQLEAADVLHKAFYETEDQKQAFHESLGLEGEILDLKKEVKDLKENVQVLIDNSTINKQQQNALYNCAKERICFLLGGKKSTEYKHYSKLYFQNLWGDVKRKFSCSGSYHDLNPEDYKQVKSFIGCWTYS